MGDWVEVPGRAGEPTRCGQVVELLGGPGHEHYQVRWDENYESMVFPRGGLRIVRRPPSGKTRAPGKQPARRPR